MRQWKWVMVFAICLLLAGTAQAAVTVNWQTGTPYQTTALTGFSTYGDMMDGMAVTATFANGSTQTAYWADTGATSGSATGTGWSLSESGDTFGGTWTFTSSVGITNLFIDAGVGQTVFDTRFIGDVEGTPGSARGWTFEYTGSGLGSMDLAVLYSGSVALTGYAAVGDLFRYLNLDFDGNYQGTFTFIADTDNMLYAGDIKPVPEPATVFLIGTGLVGLVGYRRFKRMT